MRWRIILSVVGALTAFTGLFMLLPLLIGLVYRETGLDRLAMAALVTVCCGVLAWLGGRRPGGKKDPLSSREGMAIVTLGWLSVGLFGSLPFYFSHFPDGGEFARFTNAFFESISGFTTTGSSILTDIEAVSRALLFWRSFIQWLGGMGIIVLSLAILPLIGVGGMQLYKAEVPSPVPDKLSPRVKETARILWAVYLGITAAEFILLWICGMNWYDALNHALTTLPTGGFSPRGASVGYYDSWAVDMVITLFMLLAGINFTLHYQAIRGRPLVFWRDSECRFFLGLVILITLIITMDTWLSPTLRYTLADAFRYTVFQVASIVTTTGFATADYELWPAMSQVILLFLMFVGGCAGSTGGGMKVLRIMVCFKYCYKELFSLIHPRSVSHVKIAGKPVPEDVVRSVLGFLALFMLLFALSVIALAGILAGNNVPLAENFISAFGAVAATIGNIGPGFGIVGPMDNFAGIPMAGKWLLIWCMLLGRLEIYTVIILLVPEFWRK